MDLGSTIYIALAVIAVVYSALITLQAYEFRRFACARSRNRSGRPPLGRVLLVCPCRGAEPDLEENLRPLFTQDHDDYRLMFVVDRLGDPACRPILRLMRKNPQVDARLIIAGAATDSGQKVHNLIAATVDLADDVQFLAFVDSDARPPADWLRQLVQRLDQPGVAAATAYRWLVPRRKNLSNALVHALDAGVASLVGPGKHHLVWGGSWAVRRDAFESAKLRSAWRGTLSDDLVAARALRSIGRIEFEPGAIVASQIDFDFAGMLEFARRQYTIGRFYTPAFWALAAILACLQQAALWIGAALVPITWISGGWTAVAVAAGALLYSLQVVRGWLREDAARHFLPTVYQRTATARHIAVWCGPLVGLLQCWSMLRALAGRSIIWRGIQYDLLSGGKMRITGRRTSTHVEPQRPRGGRIKVTTLRSRAAMRAGEPRGLSPRCIVGTRCSATRADEAKPGESTNQ